MTQEEYKAKFKEDNAVGWDAIDTALAKIYDKSKERHYASRLPARIGGEDHLDGVSIFDCDEQAFHRHIISFGMSELYYEPESAGKDFSRWGFEFTMRVVPFALDRDGKNPDGSVAKNEPYWVNNVMLNLARYVDKSGKWFEAYHFIPANSPIRLDTDTKLVGFAFAPDPVLGSIDTPNGGVDFLQMVGITQSELDWLLQDPKTTRVKQLIDKMRTDNPLLITDLTRVKEYA
ncbi:suppressor of fused domain protein [Campylobacter curvus]|uniref:suppressor of fused domain protein n=1 Tax=Campylobacter curvus TaxID=200 RepID=UPI00147009C7|nr:suppressor of fused domain protein [Campylobacter curvus]